MFQNLKLLFLNYFHRLDEITQTITHSNYIHGRRQLANTNLIRIRIHSNYLPENIRDHYTAKLTASICLKIQNIIRWIRIDAQGIIIDRALDGCVYN